MILQEIRIDNASKGETLDRVYVAYILFIDAAYKLGLTKSERTVIKELLKLSSSIKMPSTKDTKLSRLYKQRKNRLVFSFASYRVISSNIQMPFKSLINTLQVLRNKGSLLGKIVIRDEETDSYIFNPIYFDSILNPFIDDKVSLNFIFESVIGPGIEYTYSALRNNVKARMPIEPCGNDQILIKQ